MLHCDLKQVHPPVASNSQKITSRRMPTINTSPTMVPTAIPAMAPGDRVMVTGDKTVAVGGAI